MHINISTKALKAALTNAKKTINNDRYTLPILKCVHLTVEGDWLTILSSNLMITLRQKVTCAVTTEGTLTINHALLYNAVKAAPGPTLTLRIDGDTVYVESGGLAVPMKWERFEDEYPPLKPGATKLHEFTVQSQLLKKMLKHVLHGRATEDNRPILNSINWRDGELAAADGYQLTVGIIHAFGMDYDYCPDGDGLDVVMQLLPNKLDIPVSIAFDHNYQLIEFDNLSFMIMTREGRFPDFSMIKPKHWSSRLVVNRVEFLTVLKALLPIAVGTSDWHPALYLKDNQVGAGTNGERAWITHNGQVEGDVFDTCYNGRFLIAILENMEGTLAYLESAGFAHPLVIWTETPSVYAVLMPMSA